MAIRTSPVEASLNYVLRAREFFQLTLDKEDFDA